MHINVYDHALRYIMRFDTAYIFQDNIRPHIPAVKGCKKQSSKTVRLRIMRSKYACFELKLFVLNLATTTDRASAIEVAKRCKVFRQDFNHIYAKWCTDRSFRESVYEMVSELNPDTVGTVEYLDRVYINIHPAILSYIKRITYKKLTFIVNSYNMDYTEFHQELLLKAVETFYKEMPSSKSLLHVQNYIKRAVHNHCMNIIMEYTTVKRARLVCTGLDVNNERKFLRITSSESQMSVGSLISKSGSDYDTEYSIENDVSNSDSPMEKLETEISVDTVLTLYEKSSDKHLILTILMGSHDVGFTSWLVRNKLLHRGEDNTDYQVRVSANAFNQSLAQYMKLSLNNINRFLSKVGTIITGDVYAKKST